MRWAAILIPLFILVFLIAGNIQSFKTARRLSFELTQNQSAAVAEELALRMDLLIQKSSRSLVLLSNLWREGPRKTQRTTFLKWATGLMNTDPVFDLILYLATDNIMIVTSPNTSRPLLGLDIRSRPAKENLFKTLRKSIAPLDAPPTARITSRGALVLWFPVLIRGDEAGTMAGSLRLHDIFDRALPSRIRDLFRIRIRAGNQEVFDSEGPESTPISEAPMGRKTVSMLGIDWQVDVWPKGGGAYEELAPSDRRRLGVMLVLSLFASGFLGISLFALHRIQITRRRQQQAVRALEESEARLKAIFEQAGVGIMQCGPDYRIQHANDKLCRILGYSREELNGMAGSDYYFPEDRMEMDARIRDMNRQGVNTGSWQKRLRHKSGKTVWVRMTTSLIWSRTGTYMYSIDVVEDITLQHRLELQLRQAQKMESIGVLAGGIAHDFNNILGSILGFTQMALLDAPAPSKARERLEQVFKAANLAKDLVRQILTFSRRSEDTPQAIRVAPIIKETLKFLKAMFPANISIVQDLRNTDARVMADPTQIHQVIMNLCTNAAQAMASDGGTLKVALHCETLSGEQSREKGLMSGTHVVMTVEDTGHGIPPGIQDRIFEPYFTTKVPGEGTGMGLSVVHGIVREYEGRVFPDSLPGKGTRFRVYLPRVVSGPPSPPTTPGTRFPTGREHLILVDDNTALLDAGREMLGYLGYTVEVFARPEEALERILKDPETVDGVIADYAMPGMDGVALAQRILAGTPDMPVILCTGNSRSLDFKSLLHSGICSILIKPLVLEELAPAIRSALCPGQSPDPEVPAQEPEHIGE